MLHDLREPRRVCCGLLLASLTVLFVAGCHDETPPSEIVPPAVVTLPSPPVVSALPMKPPVVFGPPKQSLVKPVLKLNSAQKPKAPATANKAKPFTQTKLDKSVRPFIKPKLVAKAKLAVKAKSPFSHARIGRKYQRFRGYRPFPRVRRSH